MNSRFLCRSTGISGAAIVDRRPIGDERGYLERLFCAQDLQILTKGKEIVQINHSFTRYKGTVRGLHYQDAPFLEAKLVSCIYGEVYDIAVDIRADSPTFLQWHAEHLSSDNHRTFFIPEGCAHGFQTLTSDCQLIYMHTAYYSPDFEGGLHPRDPALAIPWPLPLTDMSVRDASHPFIEDGFKGL